MNLFTQRLLKWYRGRVRVMPWRGERDPYKIWLSEVMLQQTQVETVIPYYEKWLKNFPTVKEVAHASQDEILKMWEGLGYYARARNFQSACREVVNSYNGCIPEDPEAFRRLKGVGPYTSAAVQSIAFGAPIPTIDGNVKRVVSRLLILEKPPSQSLDKIERFLKKHLSRSHPGDFNQAMMDLGATICRPKNPVCLLCPVRTCCLAFKNGKVDRYPVPEKKAQSPHYQIAVGIIWKGNTVFVCRRPEKGLLGGLWEFPGGKIEKGESAMACVVREVKEETGLQVEPRESVGVIRHAYTHFSIEMEGILCEYIRGRPLADARGDRAGARDGKSWRWIRWEEIPTLAFPKANHKLFPLLPQSNPFL